MSVHFLTFSPLDLYLAGITGGLFLIRLLYYIIVYARPLRAAGKGGNTGPVAEEKDLPPVSVIVYTHGNPEDLRKNLPALLTQDYKMYEVIVVNDGSDTENEDVLKLFSHQYKNLYYTYVPVGTQYLSHKKLALMMGIKAAKHDLLLFTEADCRPESPKWIEAMTASYGKSRTELVIGFCSYRHTEGILHKLIAYDNLINGLWMISSALARHPYTGDGRNLSYRKTLFFAHKGYSRSLNLHAGADDLFVNEVADPVNTEVCYSPSSIVEMDKIENFNIWREMKISRTATRRFYKGGILFFHRMEGVASFLFGIVAIVSFILGLAGNILLSVLTLVLCLLRFTIKAVIFKRSALLLQQKPATAWLPLLEIIHPICEMYIRAYRMFNGKRDFTNNVTIK